MAWFCSCGYPTLQILCDSLRAGWIKTHPGPYLHLRKLLDSNDWENFWRNYHYKLRHFTGTCCRLETRQYIRYGLTQYWYSLLIVTPNRETSHTVYPNLLKISNNHSLKLYIFMLFKNNLCKKWKKIYRHL